MKHLLIVVALLATFAVNAVAEQCTVTFVYPGGAGKFSFDTEDPDPQAVAGKIIPTEGGAPYGFLMTLQSSPRYVGIGFSFDGLVITDTMDNACPMRSYDEEGTGDVVRFDTDAGTAIGFILCGSSQDANLSGAMILVDMEFED